MVQAKFRSPDDLWVGTSGRSRVIVYNTDELSEDDLPDSILDFTDPKWKGRIGWAPTNDGFPEFVTALRLIEGEDVARAWLEGIQDNDPTSTRTTSRPSQVSNGEVDVAFLNHYYLYRFLAERGEGFKARNYYFTNGDLGGLFLVAGVGILETSEAQDAPARFVEYLLSPKAQEYFRRRDHEYPLVEGVEPA